MGATEVRGLDLGALREAVAPVGERLGLDLVVLFGSGARGSLESASDLDVGALGSEDAIERLAADLPLLVEREVDAVDLRDPGLPLLREILRDGVLLFEARPGIYGQWLARSRETLEWFGPLYARMNQSFLKRLAEGSGGQR